MTSTAPAGRAFDITPNDSVDFSYRARALYVGATGDISLVTEGGDTVVFLNVPVGILPVTATRVNSTNTTATALIGLA